MESQTDEDHEGLIEALKASTPFIDAVNKEWEK